LLTFAQCLLVVVRPIRRCAAVQRAGTADDSPTQPCLLLGLFLGDCVDSPLARQTITAATIATFAEPLIYVEIAGIMARWAKVPWGDLQRLPILLMKDHRHIVVCPPNLYDRHRLSPLEWGAAHASHRCLSEAIPSLLEVLDLCEGSV
jgi:hypothetical protein